jgi:protein TonB
MGLVIQAGVVGATFIVPMVRPEILSVVLPQALIYVPSKPVAPIEVEVRKTTNTSPGSQNTVAIVRRTSRVFTAPSTIQPVANIIDGADFNPPLIAVGNGDASANTTLIPGATGVGLSIVNAAPPPKSEPPAPKVPSKPVRVGGDVQAANILSRVNPLYPPLAKQARIQGAVKLEGIIAKDGTIQGLRVLSGHPLLVPAAVDAVKQWRYRPTRLNGEPVEVIAPIDVNFILSN